MVAKGQLAVEQAAQWVREQLEAKSSLTRAVLIDRACLRFDLSPLQSEALYRVFAAPSDTSS